MYQSAIYQSCSTAFSDILGKFLVRMKLRKNIVVLGKNSAILAKLGKFIWECFRQIGDFFSQLEKNLVPETEPSFV